MNWLLPLLSITLLLSCQDETTAPDEIITKGLIENNTIESNGIERAYHMFIPENHINKPLVILFHGNRSSHDDIIGANDIQSPYKVWLSIAEQDDIIILIPNGTLSANNRRGWNDCRSDATDNPDADDVLFVTELLDKLSDEYEYDKNRVYAMGTSNGGHMAFQLSQEIPERITAFASIAASYPANSKCAMSNVPISALYMNGTDDPILPYEGGQMTFNRGEVLSSIQSIGYWVDRNNTSITPLVEDIPDTDLEDGCTTRKYIYTNGLDNTEVALYRIQGGGHTEPSIQERYSNGFLILVGNQNGDFEMAEEVWNFFKDKSK